MKETIDVDVRSTPKYGVFIGMGAALGIIAALVVVSIPPRADPFTPEYSLLSAFGFFAAFLGITGALLGAAVAVIIDKVSARRVKRYQVDGYFEAQVRPDAPTDDTPRPETADAAGEEPDDARPEAADGEGHEPDASVASEAVDAAGEPQDPEAPTPEAPGEKRV